jgi:hypothetical protein
MSKHPSDNPTTRLDLNHLRREARTALELAIIELAPNDLLDDLAVVSGTLEALAELPHDSAPAIALGPGTAKRGQIALDRWRAWSTARKKLA